MSVPSGSTIAERLEYYSMPITESGCWVWLGALYSPNGYGSLKLEGRNRLTHRLSWEVHNGPIPEGMLVLHQCDVRSCINPAHLFLGTYQDNTRDMMAKGRHPDRRGERHPGAKLTVLDVRAIRASTESNYKWAKRLGVSQSTIQDAKCGRNWGNV